MEANGWIDVSVSLRSGMVHWPDNPPVRIGRTLSKEGTRNKEEIDDGRQKRVRSNRAGSDGRQPRPAGPGEGHARGRLHAPRRSVRHDRSRARRGSLLRKPQGAACPPRVVFLYIPSGPAVDKILDDLSEELEEGDVLVDGGNSYWG